MRFLILPGIAAFLAIVVAAYLPAPGAPDHAAAFIPPPTLPPFGVLVVVDTTSDLTDPGNGTCSLRAAIAATNINGVAGNCSAAGSKAGATDGIAFAAGISTINIASALPAITDKLSINGGAARVELHGPGSGAGLTIAAPGPGLDGSGSSIRNLVINGFGTGISLDHVSNITIAGNRIGTNTAGSAAVPNGIGIAAYYGSVHIGGLNGVTPGGPCTGDCNLISGNTSAGIRSNGFISTTIQGNYVGTDVTGTSGIGNGTDGGIWVQQGNATIGGTAAGAGNVISGNAYGINFQTTSIDATGSVIQGNLIGTNAGGTAAIPNTTAGFYASLGNKSYPLAIGGTVAGAGNVISGNTGVGVELFTADHVAFHSNFIGTLADGTTALPNGGAGVLLSSSTHSNLIGGTGAGEGNIIATNGATGVTIGIFDYYNEIRGNSIHDNTGKGISLSDNQNGHAFTPVITGVNPITGTACANCTVDVYSDGADEGRVFEGTTTADGAGNWTYNNSVTGPNVTATATAPDVNNASNLSTSEFSVPYTLPATPTPTPTPSPTPTPTPTHTPTPTPTPTPSLTPTPTPTPTPTSAATPSPTHTGNHTPTPTPTPTPTTTPEALTQGDVDCNHSVTAVDALKELRHVAGLSVSQNEPCPVIGDNVASIWGDVDCTGNVTAVDALKILRFIAGLSVSQHEPCAHIGSPEGG